MPRSLLPFLIFGATYLVVRLGLNVLHNQLWGPVQAGPQDPIVYMVKVLIAGGAAFAVTMLTMRGRWGRGGGDGSGL